MAYSVLKFYWNIFRRKAIGMKMPTQSATERFIKNAQFVKDTISTLKYELNIISKEYNNILARQLREENAKLVAAIEEAKQKLIILECQNGIKQIPVPSQKVDVEPKHPVDNSADGTLPSHTESLNQAASKPKKEKKAIATQTIDIGRLDLRIAKIENVQRHPDADSLYVLKINTGEENPRTVCSGLVKYVSLDDLKGRTVLLLCNLKPVKMRGIVSEAMVMCASNEQGVEVLTPPPGAQPGDLVYCEGYIRQPDAVMNPKKKVFETVAPDLHTNDSLCACYKDVPLMVPGKGPILSFSLKRAPVK